MKVNKITLILIALLVLSSFSINDKREEIKALKMDIELLKTNYENLKQNIISSNNQFDISLRYTV